MKCLTGGRCLSKLSTTLPYHYIWRFTSSLRSFYGHFTIYILVYTPRCQTWKHSNNKNWRHKTMRLWLCSTTHRSGRWVHRLRRNQVSDWHGLIDKLIAKVTGKIKSCDVSFFMFYYQKSSQRTPETGSCLIMLVYDASWAPNHPLIMTEPNIGSSCNWAQFHSCFRQQLTHGQSEIYYESN